MLARNALVKRCLYHSLTAALAHALRLIGSACGVQRVCLRPGLGPPNMTTSTILEKHPLRL